MDNNKLSTAIIAALKASVEIMKIYDSNDFEIVYKNDKSPLTIADLKSNKIINEVLKPLNIPIL